MDFLEVKVAQWTLHLQSVLPQVIHIGVGQEMHLKTMPRQQAPI